MYRAHVLKHHINRSKLLKIDDIIRAYRVTAKNISDLIWREFYLNSEIKRFYTLKEVDSIMSERYKQVCLSQVLGMINSYLSNRKNEFKEHLYRSSIKDDNLRMKLLYINKYALWFNNEIKMQDTPIEKEIIILARNIIRHLLKINSKPSMNKIGLALDAKVAEIKPNMVVRKKESLSSFDYWIKLSTLDKGTPIYIPLKSNRYFESIKGKLANFIQINVDQDNALRFSLIKDIPKDMSYRSIADKIGIDIGLSCLMATSKGDMLGRGYFFEYLQKQDEVLISLVKKLSKHNIKPSRSKRYRSLVSNIRAFIKNNINRAINKVLRLYSPKEIVIERLNFQHQNLGRRLNRIIGNFGKSIISKKLNELKEMYGIKITEVNPAYTSRTCSGCGFVSNRSRKDQARFICAFCGKRLNADINASRNILARSSSVLKGIYHNRAFIIHQTIDSFLDRHGSQNSLARAINNSSYFKLRFTDEPRSSIAQS